MTVEKMPISLVLGCGGARGITHIGVIKCLEERGYDIRYISGSSMGALIGGIYAAGKLDVYEEWLCQLQRRDVLGLLDFSFSTRSLFKGDRIIKVLKELIGDCNIEDLPIGFTAVASDVNEQREVWLNKGPLFDAIRASMAVPMVFAPVIKGEKLLVDGGLINPVPIAPTLHDHTALTVAVDLNAPAEKHANLDQRELPENDETDDQSEISSDSGYRKVIGNYIGNLRRRSKFSEEGELSTFELVYKSMATVQTTMTQFKLAAYRPDLLVEVPSNLCTFFEFHRASELIEFGYQRTVETLERYERHSHIKQS